MFFRNVSTKLITTHLWLVTRTHFFRGWGTPTPKKQNNPLNRISITRRWVTVYCPNTKFTKEPSARYLLIITKISIADYTKLLDIGLRLYCTNKDDISARMDMCFASSPYPSLPVYHRKEIQKYRINEKTGNPQGLPVFILLHSDKIICRNISRADLQKPCRVLLRLLPSRELYHG